MPALLIEGKVDETAQGAADVALTYADPAAWFSISSHGRKISKYIYVLMIYIYICIYIYTYTYVYMCMDDFYIFLQNGKHYMTLYKSESGN